MSPGAGAIHRLLNEVAELLRQAEMAEPSSIGLTDLEWELFAAHATPGASAEPHLVLQFLRGELGYERLREGDRVHIKYRVRGSDVLVRSFDGCRGEVATVDNDGMPWVRFNSKDWQRARLRLSAECTSTTPLESGEFENVRPRMQALRLDPLDTAEYQQRIARLGSDWRQGGANKSRHIHAYFY